MLVTRYIVTLKLNVFKFTLYLTYEGTFKKSYYRLTIIFGTSYHKYILINNNYKQYILLIL